MTTDIMRIRYISLAVVLLTLGFGVGRLLAGSGTLDSPGPPEATSSYSLEDVYKRLDTGAAGSQSTFTEPSSGPGTGTGHTLNEVMDKAPAADDTNGATQADVANGKTFWGLNAASGQWGLQTGTSIAGNPAPVEKTGQTPTLPVNPARAGSDGDLQKGVAWPNPRFSDNGDGTVTDNLSGLIWLQDTNCIETQYPGFDNDDIAGDGRVTWQHALDFVAGINAGDYPNCGGPCTDWRLPNVRELHSLVHYGYDDLALSNDAGTGQWTNGADSSFFNVRPAYYWSSTPLAYNTSHAWGVYMHDGRVFRTDIPGRLYVWPVRGGP